jgi:flavodoxin
MSLGIMYYSRSGNSKRIAEKLASFLNAKTFELKEEVSYKGIFGFLKGGFYAGKHKRVPYEVDAEVLELDKLLIVSPLWANNATPGIQTFLRENERSGVTLVFSNDGSDVTKAFGKTKEIFPFVTEYYGITKKKNNEEEVINTIVKTFD